MLAKTEGGPAGCHSSLILQQSIPIQIARPLIYNPQAGPRHQRAIALLTTVAPPQSGTPVLVILLVQRGGYLFLHQPQLIAQVVVGFHEVLDLGF